MWRKQEEGAQDAKAHGGGQQRDGFLSGGGHGTMVAERGRLRNRKKDRSPDGASARAPVLRPAGRREGMGQAGFGTVAGR